MKLAELDYDLPETLIAQRPCAERTAARLLVVGDDRGCGHSLVGKLPELLRSPCLFVINDTRVLPARLRGTRPTGGRAELLLVEPASTASDPGQQRWTALARPARALRPGMVVVIEPGVLEAEVLERGEAGFVQVLLRGQPDVARAVERCGSMPLPPYIRREDEQLDRERYQTVFAREPGAVAAPTAGLHFSDELLAALRAHGHEFASVTLHVGPGTFAPVKGESLGEHVMHTERYEVPATTAAAVAAAKSEGRSVVAVGTTVVRTLESAVGADGSLAVGPGQTRLFVYPPYSFAVVDTLLTNFHLPRSTLLALVMAFGGVQRIRRAYKEAVDARYRFFSYGDAMLVSRPGTEGPNPLLTTSAASVGDDASGGLVGNGT